jgi:NodT family efflux transporter outer membrane factor (OMF) lipoprotein
MSGGKIAFISVLILILPGCMVGPAFRQPEPPRAKEYTAEALSRETAAAPVPGGAAQSFVFGEDIPARWWSLFHSEALDGLIRSSLAQSPTLAAAQAALRQAEENERARKGALLYPQLDAKASAQRERFSSAAFGQPSAHGITFNLFNASADVSYIFDLFGGARREIEALKAQVDYSRFQLEGAYLALSSNIATAAIEEASLRAQIAVTQDIIALQQKQLDIVQKQYELGAVSYADVLAQKTQVAQTLTLLPPLRNSLSQTRHQLAVLAGRAPAEAADMPEFALDGLELPQELPVSIPSSLVRQRPDLRASEALLHAANAQIGVATAKLFPEITITGNYGHEGVKLKDLIKSNSRIWSFGAELLQPVFHGAELTAQRRAAVAAYEQAMAQYKETVLQAFQNVADVLRALDEDANALKAQADAELAARDTMQVTEAQFRLGAVSFLSLLNAQRQYQQALIGLARARAARLADTAALFQAMGGGWWNRVPQTDVANQNRGQK